MTFRVGQEIVCVDVSPAGAHFTGLAPRLVKGQVYTVAAVGLTHPMDPDLLPCIRVFEDVGHDSPIWAHRFRPIVERKTDISFAHEILRKASRKQGADA